MLLNRTRFSCLSSCPLCLLRVLSDQNGHKEHNAPIAIGDTKSTKRDIYCSYLTKQK